MVGGADIAEVSADADADATIRVGAHSPPLDVLMTFFSKMNTKTGLGSPHPITCCEIDGQSRKSENNTLTSAQNSCKGERGAVQKLSQVPMKYPIFFFRILQKQFHMFHGEYQVNIDRSRIEFLACGNTVSLAWLYSSLSCEPVNIGLKIAP